VCYLGFEGRIHMGSEFITMIAWAKI